MGKDNGKLMDHTESKNGIIKEVLMEWPNNITILDLSHKNIADLDENLVFPQNLVDLNLSHNDLKKIPDAVLNLNMVKSVDLSHNKIEYFDDTPNFCHNVQELNLSHNKLAGPPYWVWVESPKKLEKINLSHNMNLTHALNNDYLAELLQYKTLVTTVLLFNCRIREHMGLIGTFPAAKTLELGTPDLSKFLNNFIGHIPCQGIDSCCDIERLNLSNTEIFSIEPSIDMYKDLIEINLSHNNISSLPNNFCNLENLKVCILSHNSILYLPEDMVKLKNLVCLKIDSNELCMLPDDLCKLPQLKVLDLYNNSLYEVSDEMMRMEEVDLAQNYLEEPEEEEYLLKKEKLRLNDSERQDGRKLEVDKPESEDSSSATDDEALLSHLSELANEEPAENRPLSSPEDWDSDEYWTPHFFKPSARAAKDIWIHYVKSKMKEGNFCPMDLHPVSITETVKYEKQCNPKIWTVVQGQFDDYSEDDS